MVFLKDNGEDKNLYLNPETMALWMFDQFYYGQKSLNAFLNYISKHV